MARPMIAAKPASAPTELMKWWTEKAKRKRSHAALAVYVATRAPGLSGARSRARERWRRARRARRIALEHEQIDLRRTSPRPKPGRGARVRRAGSSARAWAGMLVRVEQILMELLAGTRADDLDRDVALGLEAGKPDHRLGEIDDLDRIAHLQDEHFARRAAGAARQRNPARMISCTASGIVMK